MAKIDIQYIAMLVDLAKDRDSNAFAELYAATYKERYAFAYRYLQDKYLANDAIQESYVEVYRTLNNLDDPQFFLQWLEQICFSNCVRKIQQKTGIDTFEAEGETFSLNMALGLPCTEAQAVILTFYNGYSEKEAARIIGCRRAQIRAGINSGLARLVKPGAPRV